jgi:hypothetical protein
MESQSSTEERKRQNLFTGEQMSDLFDFALSRANNFASFLVAGTVGYVLLVVTSILWAPRPRSSVLLALFVVLYVSIGTGFGYSMLRYFYYSRMLHRVIEEKGLRKPLDDFDKEVGTYGPSRVMFRYSREIAVLAGVLFVIVFALVMYYGLTS